jgi:hypothetical protein
MAIEEVLCKYQTVAFPVLPGAMYNIFKIVILILSSF